LRALCTLSIVIGVALTAAAFAQSEQDQSPVEREPTVQTTQPKGDTEQQPKQPPIIVNVAPAPKTDAERAEEAEDRHKRVETDAKLANYIGEVALFMKALVGTTLVLGLAIIGLFIFAIIQSSGMKTTIAVAEKAADEAKKANMLTRNIFVAEQRPWLQWQFLDIADITNDGRHLQMKLSVRLQNIGKTAALNISNFGKFYSVANTEAILAEGIAYYSEHLNERAQVTVANLLPTDKDVIRFSPNGIRIADLPTDREFFLGFAFHAKYEFFGQMAEIGSVYIVRPYAGGSRFKFKDFSEPNTKVHLIEWSGARRIT
jgi:multisubunit Na+/H+ antiporter MnhC subunit